jgi:hypothetical protein
MGAGTTQAQERTCDVCGMGFTGSWVSHKIKTHPRSKTTQALAENTTREAEAWLDTYHSEAGITRAKSARVSPVRVAAKAQVKTPRRVTTPRPSAKSERADTRRAVPARERELRAELREARKAFRALQARMDETLGVRA